MMTEKEIRMASNSIEALEICLEAETIKAQAQSAIGVIARIEKNEQSQSLMTLASWHQGSINEAETMIASLTTPREE